MPNQGTPRRTHCARGHEFTPENTITDRYSGCRTCRTCHREKMAARRREQRARQTERQEALSYAETAEQATRMQALDAALRRRLFAS